MQSQYRFVLLGLMLPAILLGQPSGEASLPSVIGAATPLYPIGPHTVNIQGVVRVKVNTDGRQVSDARVEDDGGNPALGRAALDNAKTWLFSDHSPTMFTITYRYILVADLPDIKSTAMNAKVVLKFPTEVEVYAKRWPKFR
jgi:hypothetical protein